MRILGFADYYLPGYLAGGPVRTISAMVDALRPEFEFWILTRNHDQGSATPYDLRPHEWHPVGGARVMYLPAAELTASRLLRIVRDLKPDVIYLNSAVAPRFALLPLVLRRLGLLGATPFVLAPRGQFAPAALQIKARKKAVFFLAARASGLYRGVLWHASQEVEAEAIRARLGRHTDVRVVPNLAVASAEEARAAIRKTPGALRVCFLGRVSAMKRPVVAFEILAGVSGTLELDVYGPLEDARLVEQCKAIAARYPATTTVRWHGAVPPARLGALLGSHHVMLLPPAGETFGHAILESLRAGCPVLISDRTPWRNLEQRHAGWDVPLEDTARFVEILRRLVDMDHAEWSRWSAGAREAAEAFFREGDRVERSKALFYEAAKLRPETA